MKKESYKLVKESFSHYFFEKSRETEHTFLNGKCIRNDYVDSWNINIINYDYNNTTKKVKQQTLYSDGFVQIVDYSKRRIGNSIFTNFQSSQLIYDFGINHIFTKSEHINDYVETECNGNKFRCISINYKNDKYIINYYLDKWNYTHLDEETNIETKIDSKGKHIVSNLNDNTILFNNELYYMDLNNFNLSNLAHR